MVSDEKPTNAAKIKLLEGAKRILPVIEDAILIEHLASIRPMARGGLPIIDEFPGYKNIFIANGGGIKGVLTSAGLGMALRDLIMTGASTLSIKDFKLSH
jgi:glycine/D-amino acid oxidase-like deaminating enzyme